MNKNVEAMKNAVTSFKGQYDNAQARIKQIEETYGKEAGEREKARQEKQLEAARAAAVKAIKDAGAEGMAAAEAWGRLDGSKLTDDIKLLDAGLVSVEDFDKLKARHADNATMLAALKRYGDKQNAAAREEMAKSGDAMSAALQMPYETRDIVTAADKQHSWEVLQKQALGMVDHIGRATDPRDWGAAFVAAALPQEIEHFGEGQAV